MAAGKLDPQLRARLQARPDAPVGLIVRVSGDLEQRADEAARRGLAVCRRLRLIGALALRATGRQALDLAGEPWVLRIEEDREVRALPS